MEIRDPVHGNIELSATEMQITLSKSFQRLRSIKQLGFAEFSFPGASHSRFLHSIGVCHMAGRAFDSIFKNKLSKQVLKYRSVARLAALLHDVGHGPLSHSTEIVMPTLNELNIEIYKSKKTKQAQANHEDYTIKYVCESSISKIISENEDDFTPYHVACLIDKTLLDQDQFFVHEGLNYRPLLSQLVSSELDVDRMDYLIRDAYFCGTDYGKIELDWLITNMTSFVKDNNIYLSLNRRALYTFDDFLLSRHNMHLMVYFHHKPIIYEEMLHRYLSSPDCGFKLPTSLDEYDVCTDHSLYQHLEQVKSPWAQRIAGRKPYIMIYEEHALKKEVTLTDKFKNLLEENNISVIFANSEARLSRYHSGSDSDLLFPLYVVNSRQSHLKPVRIEEQTEVFKKYEQTRSIERLYVSPEDSEKAQQILFS